MRDEELLNGWIPYRLLRDENGRAIFRWLYVGDHPFTEPFFEESITACLSLPQNASGKLPVTSAETVVHIAEQAESPALTAFIYHISRCGSTLLAQLLSCDPCNIVLSEVPLLDAILRMPAPEQNDPSVRQLFSATLKLLARRRTGNEQRLFVKTDSWHVLFYDQLHTWYADAPSFLLYRSPKEVGASQAKQPAMHSVPGVIEPSLFHLDEEEALSMNRGRYLDHVLACYFSAYAAILKSDEAAFALSYHDGVKVMMQKIFNTCGFIPGEHLAATMEKRAQFHSKDPEKSYGGDAHGPSGWDDFVQSEKMFEALEQVIADQQPRTNEA